jgi:hypothetical protein
MDAETLRLNFTSRNIEAVFGHRYECWVQDRDFWVKHLHPEDRSRALAAAHGPSRSGTRLPLNTACSEPTGVRYGSEIW